MGDEGSVQDLRLQGMGKGEVESIRTLGSLLVGGWRTTLPEKGQALSGGMVGWGVWCISDWFVTQSVALFVLYRVFPAFVTLPHFPRLALSHKVLLAHLAASGFPTSVVSRGALALVSLRKWCAPTRRQRSGDRRAAQRGPAWKLCAKQLPW